MHWEPPCGETHRNRTTRRRLDNERTSHAEQACRHASRQIRPATATLHGQAHYAPRRDEKIPNDCTRHTTSLWTSSTRDRQLIPLGFESPCRATKFIGDTFMPLLQSHVALLLQLPLLLLLITNMAKVVSSRPSAPHCRLHRRAHRGSRRALLLGPPTLLSPSDGQRGSYRICSRPHRTSPTLSHRIVCASGPQANSTLASPQSADTVSSSSFAACIQYIRKESRSWFSNPDNTQVQ